MNLSELSGELRDMAQRVESMRARLTLPSEKCGLQEAVERLRAVLGADVFFSIKLELDFHTHSPPSAEWSIYEQKSERGGNFHKGATLAAALQHVAAAFEPPAVEPLADAQRVIDGAAAPAEDPDLDDADPQIPVAAMHQLATPGG